LFREREEFTADVTQFCNDLRATTPMDPAQPVMVAGDPQWKYAARRMAEGIPVGPGLLNQVRQIAQACAAPWVLD
jgi:LDH2 family malate/lactate/ureidoglycolate dehydrogenase